MKRTRTPAGPAMRRLERAAKAAAARAYAPYSKFRVGAAVLASSGRIYRGCNVENAAYGLCSCAEKTAVLAAVAAGERRLLAVAVYTPTEAPTAPCGGCRQVISEFGPDSKIVCVCDSAKRLEATLHRLLPHNFGPKDLFRKKRSL